MIKEIRNVWWDYFSILSSQIITAPLSIIYISLVIRYVGPEKWGAVTFFMSIVHFFFSWMLNWTSSYIVRFGKEEFIKNNHIRKTFGARLLIICIIFIFSLFSLYFFKFVIIEYVGISEQIFYLLYLMLLIYTLSDFITWILKAIGLMRQFALSSFLRQLTLIFLVIIYIYTYNILSVKIIINLEIISYLMVVIFCLFFLKYKYFFPLEINIREVNNLLSYSWPFIFIFLFGYASNWMDIYFIKHYLSLYHVGIYQVAYRMLQYINIFLMSIPILLFPVLMTIKIQRRNDIIAIYIKNFIPQISLLWNIFLLLLITISYFMIRVIFGSSFDEAVLPFMLLLLGTGFQVLAAMYSPIFSIYDWLKYHTLITIIMCIVNFVGNLILIPIFGISGAAVATTVSCTLSSTLYLIVVNKLMSIKTYKALFYPILSILYLLLCLNIQEIYLRVFFMSIIISIFLFIAKHSKIFNTSDIVLLEKIEMPLYLRKGISKIYLSLS